MLSQLGWIDEAMTQDAGIMGSLTLEPPGVAVYLKLPVGTFYTST